MELIWVEFIRVEFIAIDFIDENLLDGIFGEKCRKSVMYYKYRSNKMSNVPGTKSILT